MIVPDKPTAQLIREQAVDIARLNERLDRIGVDLLRIETAIPETKRFCHEIDKQVGIDTRDIARLEKKLVELLTRRWELWKLILAALIGSLLTVGSGFVSKSLERFIPGRPNLPTK